MRPLAYTNSLARPGFTFYGLQKTPNNTCGAENKRVLSRVWKWPNKTRKTENDNIVDIDRSRNLVFSGFVSGKLS